MNQTVLAALSTFFVVAGASAAGAQQTVTLTSSADFQQGNNEGLITMSQGRVTRAPISAGSLSGWSSTSALSAPRRDHTCIAHNGFLYVIGGYAGGAISSVSFAPISADGSVGTWNDTTALPGDRTDHASVVYNGFVYVIGGRDDSSFTSDVSFAPLNADGTVGTWSSTAALSSTRPGLSAVACNGFVYALGGNDGSEITSEVQVAAINADGSLGSWSSTTSLPYGRHLFSAVAFNGYIYSIGGIDPEWASISEVLVAPITANGSLGTWSSTTALPAALGFNFSVAQDGFLYVLGGMDTNYGNSGEVFVASINADGSVGDWTSTAPLSSPRFDHSAVAYNGFLYATGGYDDNSDTLTDVLVSAIAADDSNSNQSPDRLKGFYSHLVDLQTDTANRVIVINGQASPGGVVRLRVRLAPDASRIFGAESTYDPVALGSAIQVPGTARYAWIRLTLDDTNTTNADLATYVSDITIGVSAPPSPGIVKDGSGADIDVQNSTSTIEANWGGFTTTGGDSIASYEWAIGTAPGLTNIQGWSNVGPATIASNPSLTLGSGMKYVSVRAISSAGLKSVIAASDGVQVVVAAVEAPPVNDGQDKKACGLGANAASNAAAFLLVGVAVLARAFRPKRTRRKDQLS